MRTSTDLVITKKDDQRIRQMIESMRMSLPTVGHPYHHYLRALESELERSSVVAENEVDDEVVTMNSKVCARELDSGRCRQLTLVYSADGDLSGEKVPVLTPLGVSLVGARVGDVVEWSGWRGRRRTRIERILFQPEAARDFEL